MAKAGDDYRSAAQRVVGTLDLSVVRDSEVAPELLAAVGREVRASRSLPFATALLGAIENSDRVYDWNAAVVIARLDAALVTEAMTCVSLGRRHVESTGLAWAFGELSEAGPEIIGWLERVVAEASKSKTWWRAAFSLQKLGQGDAVERLAAQLKREGLPPLVDCLTDIGDERNLIAVLVHANADQVARGRAVASLKATYLESDDDSALTNCGWLIGRLHLVDDEILERIRELATDESHDVRYYALYALQNSPHPGGAAIAKRALSDHDPLVRRVAVRVLMALDTSESRETLRQVAAEEQDDKVLAEASRLP
jgi:HEAT repeat protein